jgi:predicted SnoaL-like aldol condensation-catalyzing enzyme
MQTGEPNSTRAVKFLQLAATGQVEEAYGKYVAPDFIHHNPWFAGDRATLAAGMAASARTEPNKSFQVQRVIGEGELVAVHSRLERVDAGKVYAVVHILRFAGNMIAEMWDVSQEAPAQSPNARGMF